MQVIRNICVNFSIKPLKNLILDPFYLLLARKTQRRFFQKMIIITQVNFINLYCRNFMQKVKKIRQ